MAAEAGVGRRRTTSSSSRQKLDRCPKCSNNVKGNDQALQCERCESWLHLSCTDVPSAAYEFLGKISGVLWVCSSCIDTAKSDIKTEAKLPEVLPDSFKLSLQDHLTETIERVFQEKVVDKLNLPSTNSPQTPPKGVSFEHSLGIRVNNIPEIKDNPTQSLTKDTENIANIVSFLGADVSSIVSIKRIGKPDNERKSPRPVLVTFKNQTSRNKILTAASKLKDYASKVYIAPMLSKEEYTIEQKLLKKRRDLINEGVERSELKIRNLKLYQNNSPVEVN